MSIAHALAPSRDRKRRQERALLLLERKGPLLETARKATVILKRAEIPFAVVGGIAVFLHGYERTTADVDVYVGANSAEAGRALLEGSFDWDAKRREFIYGTTPLQLLPDGKNIRPPKAAPVELEGISVIDLADLINMKLKLGTENLTRAKDLGDVVELIRAHQLGKSFVRRIDKDLRGSFREIVEAFRRERLNE